MNDSVASSRSRDEDDDDDDDDDDCYNEDMKTAPLAVMLWGYRRKCHSMPALFKFRNVVFILFLVFFLFLNSTRK